ncbi:MAG: DUF4019 domain-containing protein [Brevundimonas sp.]|uniref:helix-turn-helix domain-containing protein n=1 Tax=Brevundimonas sp. TaxID=1871086 RepID=UPI002736F76E|nr:DUF4019 domain-containing protein [Brevundimonas sp.]MDP3404474.1 DUF4019 domain-containing protein [Brevundimonas sp.]
MRDGTGGLTEREKETLRLLARGHDAKSVAQHMGLSVHTVNERLRIARRKLGVSSSRAAARQLVETERDDPQFSGDKKIGDVAGVAGGVKLRPSDTHRGRWWALGTGGFAMLALAAVALAIHLSGIAPPPSEAAPPRPSAVQAGAEEAGADSLAWLALLDRGDWGGSWGAAGALFRGQVSVEDWTTSVRAVRDPLGAVVSRTPQGGERTASLPGAPAGDYWILQYRTAFANRNGAAETVILVREGGGWKVIGYFIR